MNTVKSEFPNTPANGCFFSPNTMYLAPHTISSVTLVYVPQKKVIKDGEKLLDSSTIIFIFYMYYFVYQL